jgi:hypothetical protein
MKQIAIWGAGNNGKEFYEYVNKTVTQVLCFVDNNGLLWDSTLNNVPIISPNKLLDMPEIIVVVCTVFEDEVLDQCKRMGLKNVLSGKLSVENYGIISEYLRPEVMPRIIKNMLEPIRGQVHENYWRNIFVDTVKGYDWYNVTSISLGRWAIGYSYAYVLSRTLNSLKPSKILECGLGQSTKIINSYVKYYPGSWADIVEQDYDWLSFFTNENMINDRVKIHHRDIKQINQNGKSCYVYNDFGSVVSGNKYTVISIDGPWGSKEISRIDVIDYIPELLDESFAILLDDYHKPGEQAMVRMLSEKLNSCGILHSIKSYGGEKAMAIIVSENNRFLTTL